MGKIAPLSKFTEQETISGFVDSLHEAASVARKLAKAQKKQQWVQVAHLLDAIVNRGKQMIEAKALSRADVLVMLDAERRNMNAQHVAEQQTKSKIILN